MWFYHVTVHVLTRCDWGLFLVSCSHRYWPPHSQYGDYSSMRRPSSPFQPGTRACQKGFMARSFSPPVLKAPFKNSLSEFFKGSSSNWDQFMCESSQSMSPSRQHTTFFCFVVVDNYNILLFILYHVLKIIGVMRNKNLFNNWL